MQSPFIVLWHSDLYKLEEMILELLKVGYVLNGPMFYTQHSDADGVFPVTVQCMVLKSKQTRNSKGQFDKKDKQDES